MPRFHSAMWGSSKQNCLLVGRGGQLLLLFFCLSPAIYIHTRESIHISWSQIMYFCFCFFRLRKEKCLIVVAWAGWLIIQGYHISQMTTTTTELIMLTTNLLLLITKFVVCCCFLQLYCVPFLVMLFWVILLLFLLLMILARLVIVKKVIFKFKLKNYIIQKIWIAVYT